MFDEFDDLGEYDFFKVSFWKPAKAAASAGRKVFIQGIRAGIKSKTPAQKALAEKLKAQGKKMLGRASRGYSEGADYEGGVDGSDKSKLSGLQRKIMPVVKEVRSMRRDIQSGRKKRNYKSKLKMLDRKLRAIADSSDYTYLETKYRQAKWNYHGNSPESKFFKKWLDLAIQIERLDDFLNERLGSVEDEGADYECKTPGNKIRSKGRGRGLATGKGKGPIGRFKSGASRFMNEGSDAHSMNPHPERDDDGW